MFLMFIRRFSERKLEMNFYYSGFFAAYEKPLFEKTRGKGRGRAYTYYQVNLLKLIVYTVITGLIYTRLS